MVSTVWWRGKAPRPCSGPSSQEPLPRGEVKTETPQALEAGQGQRQTVDFVGLTGYLNDRGKLSGSWRCVNESWERLDSLPWLRGELDRFL